MKRWKNLAAAVVLAFGFAGAAQAGNDLSPADSKAMHDYTLSMDKVKAMGAAMDDFQKLSKTNPALAQQAKSVGDTSNSLAEMEAKVKGNPQLMAVYAHRGLSAEDAVVMPFVLMYAGMCVQYPSAAAGLAQQTSPAQIAFYKAHQGELKTQAWLSGK